MKQRILLYLGISLSIFSSCRQYVEREITNNKYFDIHNKDTLLVDALIAVTDEEYLQYGSKRLYFFPNGIISAFTTAISKMAFSAFCYAIGITLLSLCFISLLTL